MDRVTLSIKYYGEAEHRPDSAPMNLDVEGLETQISAVTPGGQPLGSTRLLENGYLNWVLPARAQEEDPRRVQQIRVTAEKANAISLSAQIFSGFVIANTNERNGHRLSLCCGSPQKVPVPIQAHEPLIPGKHYVILIRNLGGNSFSAKFVEEAEMNQIEQDAQQAALLFFAFLNLFFQEASHRNS